MAKKQFKNVENINLNYSELNLQRDEDGELSPITYNAIRGRIDHIKAELKDANNVNLKELRLLQSLIK
jgi:hypothetical protein